MEDIPFFIFCLIACIFAVIFGAIGLTLYINGYKKLSYVFIGVFWACFIAALPLIFGATLFDGGSKK